MISAAEAEKGRDQRSLVRLWKAEGKLSPGKEVI
jgi:hypothetical protein